MPPGNARSVFRVCVCRVRVEQDGSEGDSRYLAPEVLQGGKTSKRPPADVFSLGMSAFELVWNVVLVGRGAAWSDLRKGKLPDIDPTLGRSPDLIRLVSEVCVCVCTLHATAPVAMFATVVPGRGPVVYNLGRVAPLPSSAFGSGSCASNSSGTA